MDIKYIFNTIIRILKKILVWFKNALFYFFAISFLIFLVGKIMGW